MGRRCRGRQGDVGRCRDARRSSPISANTRPRSPTSFRRSAPDGSPPIAGVADRTGWCPIDPVTFESKLQPNIHVIGDAAIAGAHAEIGIRGQCAGQGLRRRRGGAARRQNAGRAEAHQHLLQPGAPDYGISVAGVYAPANGLLADAEGAGGVSPLDAPRGSARARPDMPSLVRDDHRGSVRIGQHASAFGRLPAHSSHCPASRCAASVRSPMRRATPFRIADRRARRSRARPRDRRRPARASACCATPALSRGALPGRSRAESGGRRRRWSEGQLRLRLVDAARLNPATIMPSYYRVDGLTRVAPNSAASRC